MCLRASYRYLMGTVVGQNWNIDWLGLELAFAVPALLKTPHVASGVLRKWGQLRQKTQSNARSWPNEKKMRLPVRSKKTLILMVTELKMRTGRTGS